MKDPVEVNWAQLLRQFVADRPKQPGRMVNRWPWGYDPLLNMILVPADPVTPMLDASDRSGRISDEELRDFMDQLKEMSKDVKFVEIPFAEDEPQVRWSDEVRDPDHARLTNEALDVVLYGRKG